jgi:GT2 family glycosyltransferase
MLFPGEPPPDVVTTLESLQAQVADGWQLTVVLHAPVQASFTALLVVSGLQRTSRRVRVVSTEETPTPDQLLDTGLRHCAGSDVALIFPGDVWAPDAVAQITAVLQADSVVYADEDRVTAPGEHGSPLLKPDYSPELLLSSSYVGRPFAMGADVVQRLVEVGPGHAAHLEHDLALRACEVSRNVVHIPEVLCHCSAMAAPSEAPDCGHVDAALRRRGEEGEVRPGPAPGTFRVRRAAGTAKASIIVPFRDQPQFLRTCIDSIDATTKGQSCEIVLVDNGSVQPETLTLVERFEGRSDIQLLHDERPFNWATLSNAGAAAATGEVLVFLNNDIEAHVSGWLEALCAQALRSTIGAVGARLLYPDRRVQHCGVVIGLGGAAGHALVGLEGTAPGYLNMAVVARECAAVTGACLATRRDVFDALAGFDEALGVDLNDIDFCLRAQRSGWRVLMEPAAELVHHESPSRGTAGDTKDIVHFINRWRDSIVAGDPYLNPHLTRADASCRLRGPHEEEWWQQWQLNLTNNS